MEAAFPVTLQHAYAILRFARLLILLGLVSDLWSLESAHLVPPNLHVGLTSGVLIAATVLEEMWRRRVGVSERSVLVQGALNVVAAVGLIWLMEAGGHPAVSLLAVLQLPMAAAVGARSSMAFAVILCAAHHAVVGFAPDVIQNGLTQGQRALSDLRGWHQAVGFDLTVFGIAYFASRLRAMVARRDEMIRSALEERARTQRLASLGTMAAGIAHELGTPLSSIDLLASEAMAEPAEASSLLCTLRGEVSRCRSILDRLRGAASRTASAEVESLGHEVPNWFADWRRAALGREDAHLEVDPSLAHAAVAGAGDEWRGVVWSLLDNAQRAGAPVVARLERESVDRVLLTIDDAGEGPSPEVLQRAGTAFFSAWGDGQPGGGLGIYAARAFARRHGAEVTLERRPEGGGRISVRWTTISSADRKAMPS